MPPNRVYPRVGGETTTAELSGVQVTGLSPRGRGNRRRRRRAVRRAGSIPAWAGKPCPSLQSCSTFGVYPRVGGETNARKRTNRASSGLSPRGRGNPSGDSSRLASFGSIPAWAGKPRAERGREIGQKVYPRVGGETGRRGPRYAGVTGLSPRGRGNRSRAIPLVAGQRSIPAWAGKPWGTR